MNGGYLVHGLTEEEQVASDPFGGRGLFLPMEARGDVILAALERAAGAVVPACALDGHGVWVDTGAPQVDCVKLITAWESLDAAT
jgi:hypothetical protein